MKKARSGSGAFAAAQTASTNIARAWLRPALLTGLPMARQCPCNFYTSPSPLATAIAASDIAAKIASVT